MGVKLEPQPQPSLKASGRKKQRKPRHMTSYPINNVAVHHTGNQSQAAIHTLVAGHSHAIPGREVAGEVAVGIDQVDPAVGSPTGNRTKSVGHQGADHTEAELDPGVAVGHILLLRTGLPRQVGVHCDVRCLARPWYRRRNQ